MALIFKTSRNFIQSLSVRDYWFPPSEDLKVPLKLVRFVLFLKKSVFRKEKIKNALFPSTEPMSYSSFQVCASFSIVLNRAQERIRSMPTEQMHRNFMERTCTVSWRSNKEVSTCLIITSWKTSSGKWTPCIRKQ